MAGRHNRHKHETSVRESGTDEGPMPASRVQPTSADALIDANLEAELAEVAKLPGAGFAASPRGAGTRSFIDRVDALALPAHCKRHLLEIQIGQFSRGRWARQYRMTWMWLTTIQALCGVLVPVLVTLSGQFKDHELWVKMLGVGLSMLGSVVATIEKVCKYHERGEGGENLRRLIENEIEHLLALVGPYTKSRSALDAYRLFIQRTSQARTIHLDLAHGVGAAEGKSEGKEVQHPRNAGGAVGGAVTGIVEWGDDDDLVGQLAPEAKAPEASSSH